MAQKNSEYTFNGFDCFTASVIIFCRWNWHLLNSSCLVNLGDQFPNGRWVINLKMDSTMWSAHTPSVYSRAKSKRNEILKSIARNCANDLRRNHVRSERVTFFILAFSHWARRGAQRIMICVTVSSKLNVSSAEPATISNHVFIVLLRKLFVYSSHASKKDELILAIIILLLFLPGCRFNNDERFFVMDEISTELCLPVCELHNNFLND